MVCSRTQAVCDSLAETMRQHPRSFYGFTMEYIINGQRSARRQVQITGESIISGRLFAQLENMPGAPAADGTRYLNSEDLNKVVHETTMNVVASVVSDSDYVDTGDDVSISSLVERELKRQQVSSQQLDPHMWDSVFWNPAWARPDKLTSFLNEVLTKDATGNDTFTLTEQSRIQVRFPVTVSQVNSGSIQGFNLMLQSASSGNQNEKGGDAERLGFIKSLTSEDQSSGSRQKVSRDRLLRALSDRHRHVEWTGEVFRVKPTRLYRLNLSAFRSRSSIAVGNIQVHR